LRRNGTEVRRASIEEDVIFKIDFWVRPNSNEVPFDDKYWFAVQFSIDKEAIMRWKGLDAIEDGIIPMWIDGEEVRIAYLNGNGIKLVIEFWNRFKKVLIACPTIKRFREPRWFELAK
jgi:hypothetical protein